MGSWLLLSVALASSSGGGGAGLPWGPQWLRGSTATTTTATTTTATTSKSVTLPEADYRAYVRDSRQLDACRTRYDGALVQLGEEQARSLALHAQVGACLDRSREDDAALVAERDAWREAYEKSERKRGRLRTAGAVVLGVVAGLVAGLAVR